MSSMLPAGYDNNDEVDLDNDSMFVSSKPKLAPLATVLLSARLDVMVEEMDKKTVNEELKTLLEETKPENWQPPIDFTTEISLLRRVEKAIHTFNLRIGGSADPVSAAHLMHTKQDRLILGRLRAARRAAYLIRRNMRVFHTDEERSIYLFQQFLVHSLRGFSRHLAYRHFFEEFDGQRESRQPRLHHLCIVLVPLYICTLIFYMFLFGLSLDGATANFWFIEILVVFSLSTFIVGPLTVFIRYIALTQSAQRDIQAVLQIIMRRHKIIIHRSTGLMNHSHALMHHFNPAARAARKFPELQMARVIMCLNDFDIPVTYNFNTEVPLYARLMKVSFFPVFLLFFLGFFLPYFIQDAIVEALSISGFNFGIVGMYALGTIAVYVPVSFGLTVLLGGMLVYKTCNHKFSLPKARIVPERPYEISESHNSMDVLSELDEPIRGPQFRRGSRSAWR